MRLLPSFSWMLLCGSLAFFAPVAQAQPATRVAGHIVVAKVRGTVTAVNADDPSRTTRPLADNDWISQHYVVTTGAGSGAILIFSNGATINLGADSTLSIDEFLQDPFGQEIKLADMKEEPTTSVTKLNLSHGELVGDVKHLHQDQGSSFTVSTPVGAAGIRGTTFRIVFRPDASGKVFFTLSTAAGQVLFEAPAAAGLKVDAGKEVVVNVDATVNSATGAITVNRPPTIGGTSDISAANQAAIARAVQAIVDQSSKAIIDSTAEAAAKAAADKAAADKAAADKAAADKAASDKAAADKAAADKAASDKAASDKAASDKAASDKAAADKAAAALVQPQNNPPANTPAQQTTPGDGR